MTADLWSRHAHSVGVVQGDPTYMFMGVAGTACFLWSFYRRWRPPAG